jgi:hypothetical protein
MKKNDNDELTAPKRSPPTNVLDVANIEVIYNHVILVLKGVSLAVPQGAIVRPAGRQRRRQVDDAQGDLQPAAEPSAARSPRAASTIAASGSTG